MKRGNQLKFVVVGTGRSGTGYASKLFTAAGLKCGHEQYYGFLPGIGEVGFPRTDPLWRMRRPIERVQEEIRRYRLDLDGDASWLAVPRLNDFDGLVMLQLRHPVPVVNSLVGMEFFTDPVRHFPYRDYALQFFDLSGDPTEDALRWWLTWNQRATKDADAVFALESWSIDLLSSLLELIGVDGASQRAEQAFASVSPNVNSSESRGNRRAEFGWTDFPDSPTKDQVAAAAQQWGYDVLDVSHVPAVRL